MNNLEKELILAKNLRQLLKQGLEPYKDRIIIHSHPTNQVDQIIGLSLQGLQGQYVMLECNRYDGAISTGSACQKIGRASCRERVHSSGARGQARREEQH